MPGAGKTEVVSYLESKGYKKVYFGGITMEEVKRRNLEVNEANERQVREDLRRQHGMAAFAILSLPKIREILKTRDFLVLESLYSWEEYLVIKKEFGDALHTLAVYAPPSLRYARLAVRPHRPLTSEQAQSRDLTQIQNLNIAPPIAMADFLIANTGTKEGLYQEVDGVLTKLGR